MSQISSLALLMMTVMLVMIFMMVILIITSIRIINQLMKQYVPCPADLDPFHAPLRPVDFWPCFAPPREKKWLPRPSLIQTYISNIHPLFQITKQAKVLQTKALHFDSQLSCTTLPEAVSYLIFFQPSIETIVLPSCFFL